MWRNWRGHWEGGDFGGDGGKGMITKLATRFRAILANVNIAFIDIATGEDSEFILQNLKTCQLNSDVLYGYE
jgi:hypothetical protein